MGRHNVSRAWALPGYAGVVRWKNELKKCLFPYTLLERPDKFREAASQSQVIRMTVKVHARVFSAAVAMLLSVPFCIPAAAQGANETGKAEQAKADAREKDEGGEGGESQPRIFGLDAGVQGNYASGVSTSSFDYQPFVDLYLKHKYVKFTAGISRFQDYQISNGGGEFETVNFTQPKLALSLYPHRVVELFGEYYYSSGDKKHYYRSNEGTAGFFLDFEKVTFGTTVTDSKTEYHFKSDDRKDKTFIVYKYSATPGKFIYQYERYSKKYINRMGNLDVYPELSWFVHKTTSLDFKYEYKQSLFEYVTMRLKYYNYKYFVNTGRLGVYSEPWRYFSFKAGIHAGKDVQDYIIAGGDLSVTFNILDYVKISSTYTPEWYKPPTVNPSIQALREIFSLAALGRRGNINPYMRASRVGKSFWNQSVNFSVMYTY